MPAPKDLVFQQSTSIGTSDFTLTTQFGKQTFASAFGTGVTTNVFDYFISNRSANEWEVGTGHMADATTLVRDTVVFSSNSNLAVNFTSGIKDVTNDIPAQYQVRTSTTSVTNNHAVVFDGTSGSLIKSAGIPLGTVAQYNSPLPVANGGTGSITAADARTALGVQQSNSTLNSLSGLTLASGDTLYASAASTLARLAAGTNGNVLKLLSGLPSWGLPFNVSLNVFTTVGANTYTPPTNLIGAIVICTGGGGGGTGVTHLNTTTSITCAGAGGGSGGTAISFLTGNQIGTLPITVTIGSGGAAGTATITTSPATAGSGGATSFGSLVIGNGGSGAPAYTASGVNNSYSYGAGGAGGTGSGSFTTLIVGGSTGIQGSGSKSGTASTADGSWTANGGAGGASFWAQGTSTLAIANSGALTGNTPPAQRYGAGGGGAALAGTSNTAANGGAGQSGVCMVLNFFAT